MQPSTNYVETTLSDIKNAFAPDDENFQVDLSSTAGLLMLASIAIPKEKAWEEFTRNSNNGNYTPSTRVTKKSRSIEIFKNNQDKTRDAIIKMMVDELDVHRIAACDFYRWCDQNRKEVLFDGLMKTQRPSTPRIKGIDSSPTPKEHVTLPDGNPDHLSYRTIKTIDEVEELY